MTKHTLMGMTEKGREHAETRLLAERFVVYGCDGHDLTGACLPALHQNSAVSFETSAVMIPTQRLEAP